MVEPTKSGHYVKKEYSWNWGPIYENSPGEKDTGFFLQFIIFFSIFYNFSLKTFCYFSVAFSLFWIFWPSGQPTRWPTAAP